MTKQTHWEWLISETEYALKSMMIDEKTGVTIDDIKLVISVLKDNVPFCIDNK